MKYVKGKQVQFRFVDLFRFMASSLEKFVSSLKEHKIVSSVFWN